MPDPEETERDALAAIVSDTLDEGFGSGKVADQILAAGFRRLSDSERTVTERVHDLLDELTGAEVEVIFHSYWQEGVDARAASGIIDPVRLSESGGVDLEIRRDQAEKDAGIATWGLASHEPTNCLYEPSPKIADAIRAQFTPSPETEPGPDRG